MPLRLLVPYPSDTQFVLTDNCIRVKCMYIRHCFGDRYVIAELIETEKDYVKDLGLLVEVRYWLLLHAIC